MSFEAEKMTSLDGRGYCREMGFDALGFSPDEEEAIGGFYDYSRADGKELPIQPIDKEDFEFMKAFLPDVCLLWHDGESNYAGVYVTGPLRGKVMFFCHDDPNHAPLFRDMASFLQRVKSGEIDYLDNPSLGSADYPCDYPARVSREPEKTQNLETAKRLLDELRGMKCDTDEEDSACFQTAIKAWYLMPPEHLDLLFPLLKSRSMYVGQDLPGLFVFHGCKAAIPALRDAAANGGAHVKASARRALEKLGA